MSNVHVSDRHVSEPLECSLLTRELSCYTIKITQNEKVFNPLYQRAMTDKLISTAIEIHTACWAANNILVKSHEDYSLRVQSQNQCCRKCNEMLALIDISWKLYHLDSKRVRYWTQRVVECRNKVRAWKESDSKRYAEYR